MSRWTAMPFSKCRSLGGKYYQLVLLTPLFAKTGLFITITVSSERELSFVVEASPLQLSQPVSRGYVPPPVRVSKILQQHSYLPQSSSIVCR